MKDGTIAGSTTNLFQGFRNLLRFGVPFADALAACTINPARVIGADKDAGSIEEGKRADLIFVDDSMNLKHVMVKGKMIF
ncbi:MAG: amidohydrolase family protein [Clostridia bacterium]|nr:amidohydrolase family protein [Clostridia bacterium]